MNQTPYINSRNIQNIQYQISLKKGFNPYHATIDTASSVLTDYDTFPYPRYFRGIPSSDVPVVAEREAGYRPRYDSCYKMKKDIKNVPYPNNCFQQPCSTISPCYNKDVEQNGRPIADTLLNNSCIVQYR
jgi:hypothetical protein